MTGPRDVPASRRPVICGLGMTELGKVYGPTAAQFAADAVRLAAADAGLALGDIDGLLVSSGVTGGVHLDLQLDLGLRDLALLSEMQAYGSTAGAMVQVASMAVQSGMAGTVACVWADAPLRQDRSGAAAYGAAAKGMPGWRGLSAAAGITTANHMYAMAARRHMERYGTTSEQLGAVAVAQRDWAALNPLAHLRTPITIEDYLASRWVAEPFHLLDCCLVSNGGIAVIVTSANRAAGLRQPPVYVRGWAQAHPGHSGRRFDDFGLVTGAATAGPAALRMAGVELADIDLAAVLDARLRHRLGAPVPLPSRPWSEQVPALADPARQAYVAEIAAMMDARKDRIGEHAASHPPAWATAALGPVTADPADRLEWQKRAAAIGAWRELSGYDHPADPIGPEPVTAAPDARAVWHQALAALGPVDGPDVRGMPDGRLLHLRDTYPIETAWAPRYVGDELRQVRGAAWNVRLAGLRAAAEARAVGRCGDHDHAAAKHKLAAGYQALEQAYRQRETVFATVMADRADWEAATRAQRHLAIAADAELRRRHPGQHFSPLRSAEPEPVTQAQRDELALTPDQPPGEIDKSITDLTAGHRTFADRLADRQSQTVPSEDPDYGDHGPAFPTWTSPGQEPILQPPKPEIPPSPRILEYATDRDADWEAAD